MTCWSRLSITAPPNVLYASENLPTVRATSAASDQPLELSQCILVKSEPPASPARRRVAASRPLAQPPEPWRAFSSTAQRAADRHRAGGQAAALPTDAQTAGTGTGRRRLEHSDIIAVEQTGWTAQNDVPAGGWATAPRGGLDVASERCGAATTWNCATAAGGGCQAPHTGARDATARPPAQQLAGPLG